MAINPLQKFNNFIQFSNYFKDEATCIEFYKQVRWGGVVTCPKCDHSAYEFEDGKRFKCSNKKCDKVFSYKVGSIFENSKPSMQKWFWAIFLLVRKDVSSHQLAEDIGVTQATAWFMLHRLRYVISQLHEELVLGLEEGDIIEADEKIVGGENIYKHFHKKVANSQGRSLKGKMGVFGLVERRSGDVVVMQVSNTNAETLHPIMKRYINRGANVMTDEWTGYQRTKEIFNHNKVNHGAKQFTIGKAHTNTMEGRWAIMQRTIDGTNIHISHKHTQAYLDKFAYRNNTRKIDDTSRFILFLSKTAGKRMTYWDLVHKADVPMN